MVRFSVYKDYAGLFRRIIKFCNLSVHFLACMYVSLSAANDLRAEVVNCHLFFLYLYTKAKQRQLVII